MQIPPNTTQISSAAQCEQLLALPAAEVFVPQKVVALSCLTQQKQISLAPAASHRTSVPPAHRFLPAQ
jgi:hypothetical protein